MDKHLDILTQLMILKWDIKNNWITKSPSIQNSWTKWYITSYFIDE